MKLNTLLCFGLILLSQTGYCAGVVSAEAMPSKTINNSKVSVIGKALNEQKIKGETPSNNKLKVLRSMNVTPTQNFFSAQNQKVTLLIQSFFS
ncbi:MULTISPECIES: hypothetical protein [unclassified Acinetobacter]|uniref:hypothetical protein n=1 Tax=unclassified Acinetobacter TaxID=196816 RepID=UPI002934E269|nr:MULTISPECIES: hypothetical protein [unclassified Acinetobacter]WOE31055.1 hypothetical protein QSG84_11995 [Acinetobacter sp. SAAs470]WOE39251.1 hypothetical protein QSG86_05660 [Acinetobacter sp. SAAs474]